MNIAVIPARGGSKRVPDKNIREIGGKPLILYTLEAAIKAEVFDHIFVSTDCPRIQELVNRYGTFATELRPKEFANDLSPTSDAVRHAVELLEFEFKTKCDVVAILQPTSPLRDSQHIRSAFEYFRLVKPRSVVSICETECSSLLISELSKGLRLDGLIPRGGKAQRSQDCATEYRINGAIYLIDREKCPDFQDFYSRDCYGFLMNRLSSVDIDTYEDFELAEALLTYMGVPDGDR